MENFSDEKLGGFKDWLKELGIDTSNFTEEHYKTVFLFAAFNQFQQEMMQYRALEKRMKEAGVTPEQIESGEVDPNELLSGQYQQKNKKKIFTPDTPNSNVVDFNSLKK